MRSSQCRTLLTCTRVVGGDVDVARSHEFNDVTNLNIRLRLRITISIICERLRVCRVCVLVWLSLCTH